VNKKLANMAMAEAQKFFHGNVMGAIGDIVLFDNSFENKEHDHMAIIVGFCDNFITTAEGNFDNISAIVKRTYEHVR